MTRNPRDHRAWTNKELEQDPQGYLAAQEAFRKDRAKAEEERIYKSDLAHFTETFVAAGGAEKDAEAAFKAQRREQAAAAARAAAEHAMQAHRRHVTNTL